MKIHFYTRPGCHLCDEARLMIGLVQEDFQLEVLEHNIELDDELHEKYMLMIPVIEKDGEVLLYGNIDYVNLVEALES
ncbi:glutaredoxin family protein [Chungangia koreensis]|uniref:Glutaredoxin family protein n=1 Tax=Chungangia koreensis TaxID=752657 RepID=A0ABV8X6G0_9LACT